MGVVVGVVAAVIALVGLLAALANAGYLAMLNSAAKKRGISGAPVADYTSGKLKGAGITAAAAALGLLMTSGGIPLDILGLLVAGGAGLAATKQLSSTRDRFRTQS